MSSSAIVSLMLMPRLPISLPFMSWNLTLYLPMDSQRPSSISWKAGSANA